MKELIARNDSPINNRKYRMVIDRVRPFIYLLPAIVIFLLFIVYPICYNIYLSFYDWNMVSPAKDYVGLKNYSKFLTSSLFKQAGLNTIGYILDQPGDNGV